MAHKYTSQALFKSGINRQYFNEDACEYMFRKTILERALDSAIEGYGKRPWKNERDKDLYISHEISHIKSIAKLQTQLDKYQAEAVSMSTHTLMAEIADSETLGKNMRASGKAKPDYRLNHPEFIGGSFI